MKALLIIDLQNDFLPGGALPVPDGDQIVPIINGIQQWFDLVVATQDWHPQSHKSFATNHPGKSRFDVIDLNGIEQTLWPDHCVQGTEGAAFARLFNANKAEVIFRKGTDAEIDSYSGFFDNGHLKSTGLADYLRGKGVTQVYLAGLAADYCVYYTALDALAEGFVTYLMEDAVRPINVEKYDSIKADLILKGVKIINSNDVKIPTFLAQGN